MLRYGFLFLALVSAGCGPNGNRPAPTMVATPMDNDVFQFQYDNGDPIETATFANYLDGWLREHPEVTVKRVVPQVVTGRDSSGHTVSKTHGLLVFTSIDPTKVRPAPAPEAGK